MLIKQEAHKYKKLLHLKYLHLNGIDLTEIGNPIELKRKMPSIQELVNPMLN
jgi:hypothetical protein